MSFFDEQPDGDIHGECALEIHRQQETIDALAEQNRLLKEALKDAAPDMLNDARRTLNTYGIADGTIYEAEKKAKLARKHMELLSLPDLSTSILNQRDARTLRGAAEWFDNEAAIIPDSGKQTVSAFQLHRLAAEKEKHNG